MGATTYTGRRPKPIDQPANWGRREEVEETPTLPQDVSGTLAHAEKAKTRSEPNVAPRGEVLGGIYGALGKPTGGE